MKPLKVLPTILSALLCFIAISGLSAWDRQAAASDLSGTPTPAPPSGGPTPALRKGAYQIPATGQRGTFMQGDDGDLEAGRPWPEPRFTVTGQDSVLDQLTGLTWTRGANQTNGGMDWEPAVAGARACTAGGFSDWRLPNRNELESLIDLGQYSPALPKGHPFTDVQSSYYWTSSTPANNEDHAWMIHLFIGFVTHDDKAGTHFVWYVRGRDPE